jgi:mono/diheme cytochrome c family protein
MKKFILTLALGLIVLLTSCSNSSDDDTNPYMDPPDNTVTYTNSVRAIINGNCIGCHGNPTTNNAPMSLTTYDNVKEAVQNRNLIGLVENGTMPLTGSRLSTSQVTAIKNWQAGGFLE